MVLVLITGGTGFIGAHCIAQLLQQGYHVRTTVRSLIRKAAIYEQLKVAGVEVNDEDEKLSFCEADLLHDSNWDKAVDGCTYVLHVASPMGLVVENDSDMIQPALEGTLRVLKAARDAKVKRVVVTSSFGAVSYGHQHRDEPFTEEDWTNLNDKTLSPYIRSKVIAEKAAWDFISQEGGELEMAVVNPTGVWGPTLSGSNLSGGHKIFQKLLDGSLRACPQISFAVCDVRDVADLHIRAMTNPNAKVQRFIAACDGEPLSFHEMAMILRDKLGPDAHKVTTKTIPDFVLRIVSWFSPVAKETANQLGKVRRASNQKAKTLLGWQPRSAEEAVVSAGESMVRLNAFNKS